METDALLRSATDIVIAYISHQDIAHDDVPAFITGVLNALDRKQVEDVEDIEPTPALTKVQINRSYNADHITCLECGGRFKTMRRHLILHGMDGDTYRRKWGLPADYPLIAENYSEQRSQLSKRTGLGRTHHQRRGKR